VRISALDVSRVSTLRAAYASGLSAHAVVDAVLERIAARGEDATWISRFDAAALHARASVIEDRWDPADRPPLYGVPFAVKDNIDVTGLPTTAACPRFAYSPSVDATCVRLLLDAGAVAVGKTNLDQFATGLNGTRSPYGAPENIYGGDLVSGGSSSGSAVAVAAGVVAFALGTDTAGSGRVPAALNGIVGLKPTRGLVSMAGVVPACRSLDCVSVFAGDLDDARAVLGVLAAPDPADPWSRVPTSRTRRGEVRDSPRRGVHEFGTRRGETRDSPWGVPAAGVLAGLVEPRFAAAFERVVAGIAEVVPVPLEPLLEAGDLLYDGPWVAERLAGLEGFLTEHPDDVLPVTRAVIERGREFDAVATFRARHRLQELRAWTERLWERADVLLLPTIPTTFTRAQMAEEPVAHNRVLGRFTQFTNLLDLAAVAIPAGRTADGRPFGVTLFGPAFSEDRLISAAAELHPSAQRTT
jgi:allophanate hydrolase